MRIKHDSKGRLNSVYVKISESEGSSVQNIQTVAQGELKKNGKCRKQIRNL